LDISKKEFSKGAMAESTNRTHAKHRQMDEIARSLISARISAAPTLALATLGYPLFKFPDSEIAEAAAAWRRDHKKSRLIFDPGKPSSVERAWFLYIVQMNAATLAWTPLQQPEKLSIDQILRCLGIALRVELDRARVSYDDHKHLEALSATNLELGIQLLGLLMSACPLNSWTTAVAFTWINGEESKVSDRQLLSRVIRRVLKNLKARRSEGPEAKNRKKRAA
jgi:hypothetical protein